MKKKALLLHNPNAGEETHQKEELIALLEDAGIDTEYRSLKDLFWKKGIRKQNLLIVAGGDGSVRKVVQALLKRKKRDDLPLIAVLPFGTANNISKTINRDQDVAAIIKSWEHNSIKPFDIGWIEGLSRKHFMIEAFGFGVFPTLVSVMKMVDEALSDDPEKRLDTALGLLAGIIRSYKTKHCTLEIDGKDHSGSYLMVEIMNICSIGPNLSLATECSPGDGQFHVVAVPESGRDELLEFVTQRLKGEEPTAAFKPVTGNSIRLSTEERNVHVDDKLVKTAGNVGLTINLDKHRLRFLA